MAKNSPHPGAAANLTFEQALEQLESIIERIESGQIGLEASIAEYERGVGLLKHCRAVLQRAEQRVVELNKEVVNTADAPDDDPEPARRGGPEPPA